MIKIENLTMPELASYICTKLEENNIKVVLSGGSCVEIYSRGDYTSYDIDIMIHFSKLIYYGIK